jgi:hypothetical protein
MQTPEEADEYRRKKRAYGSLVKSTARDTLLGITEHYPSLIAKLIQRELPDGVTYAGAGRDMIAYRVPGAVVKVVKNSLLLSDAGRTKMVDSLTAEYNVMRDYLGNVVVPQTVAVAPHPVQPALQAVQIRQQFHEFDDLDDVFPEEDNAINTDRLSEVLKTSPGLESSFYDFAVSGLAMAANHGVAPDITGRKNIGLTTGNLPEIIMVDAQPVSKDEPQTDEFILPQLEDMRRFLDAPHAI